jgi:steroid delta-isomerase-like uncharacterized protein
VTADANLGLVRRLIEAFNAGDGDLLKEIIAEGCAVVAVGSGERMRGPAELVAGLDRLHEAFPDFRLTATNVLACGDSVVVEWVDEGTNTGPFRGSPPTGRRFTRAGCTVAEIREGRIVSLRDYADPRTVSRQLGLEP